MRFDLGILDSGERSLPFGLLVIFLREICFFAQICSTAKREKRALGVIFSSTYVSRHLSTEMFATVKFLIRLARKLLGTLLNTDTNQMTIFWCLLSSISFADYCI